MLNLGSQARGRVYFVRGARQLITLNGPVGPRRGADMARLNVIEDGSLLIADGVISQVGSTRRIENLHETRNAIEIDAAGHVVMPGFIDADVHLGAVGEEAAEEEDEFRRDCHLWERRRTLPGRATQLSLHKALETLARHGTTLAECKWGFGVDESTDLKVLRTLGELNGRPIGVVRSYCAGARCGAPSEQRSQHIEWLCGHMLPRVRARRLTEVVNLCFSSMCGGVGEEEKIAECVARYGWPLKAYASGCGISRGLEIGLRMGARCIEGLEGACIEHVQQLARTETMAVVCPGGGGRHAPPARELLDAGAAVVLATGYYPHGIRTCNMQTAVALACRDWGFTPEEAITAATWNAAYACGVANRTGGLQYGKDADLIMLRIGDYRELQFAFGVNLVSLVMRRGVILYKDSKVYCPAE